MLGDGTRADTKDYRDFVICLALGNPGEDFGLPPGEAEGF
jgi:hypothetical protein